MGKFLDLTGQKFGRLTVLEKGPESKNTYGRTTFKWRLVCDCGNTTYVNTAKLKSGHTQSCGCLQLEAIQLSVRKHGMRRTPEYYSWASMKNRCLCETSESYPDWGGRGVKIHKPWINSFEQFFADMGPRPKGTTLDRIDNNGDYAPGNCRWATPKQQSNNQRSTRNFTVDGLRKTVTEWAFYLGVTRDTVNSRLKKGQTMESIVLHFSNCQTR